MRCGAARRDTQQQCLEAQGGNLHCTPLHGASSLLHQGLTQLTHSHVSGAPQDTETLQLEASLLLGHSKSCPKGFLIQTHHFFPPVSGSYTASGNSRNSSQQCQHEQAAAPGTLCVHAAPPALRAAAAPGTHLAAIPLLDSTDTHGGTTVLHVGSVKRVQRAQLGLVTGNAFIRSQLHKSGGTFQSLEIPWQV